MTIYMHSTARAAKELPMTEAERKARIELAACYRVFDMLGWAEMIFNHITLRVPGAEPRFLINPFGLHYREVTASSLVLIDLEGNVLRESQWPVNRAGFVIHSAIHGAMPDAHCVMHTHTTNGVADWLLQKGAGGWQILSPTRHRPPAPHPPHEHTAHTCRTPEAR